MNRQVQQQNSSGITPSNGQMAQSFHNGNQMRRNNQMAMQGYTQSSQQSNQKGAALMMDASMKNARYASQN